MEFQLSYFKSWKMMLWTCCTQYTSKFGKLSSGHRTGKGQLSFQPQRKAMPKDAQTAQYSNCAQSTTQLLSSHTLREWCSKFPNRLQQYMNYELPDVQAGFRKGRGTRDQIANIHWIINKAREFRKISTSVYWLCQSLWLCDHNKLWKILKEMQIPDHLTCLLRNLYAGQ